MTIKNINAKYNTNSLEGKIINHLKQSPEVNLSELVRKLLYYAEGYETVKSSCPDKVDDFCIRAIQYFKGYIETYERRLNIRNKFNDNSIHDNSKRVMNTPQNREIIANKINNLLP